MCEDSKENFDKPEFRIVGIHDTPLYQLEERQVPVNWE